MKISVALATHNGCTHLDGQLQSLLRQTLPPDEIIISDDGSTDGTLEMLQRYRADHSFIKVFSSKTQGINENFQNAVSRCRGDYIAFCDQDDKWHEEKLARLAARCTKSTLLVYGRSVLIDKDDQELDIPAERYLRFESCRSGHLPFYFIYSNCISGHAMLVSRRLVQSGMPFPDSCMYDHWLALIASVKSDIVHVPDAITYHRIHSANAANNEEINREKKTRRIKPSKYQRFSEERTMLLTRLHKALAEGEELTSAERLVLADLQRYIDAADNKVFSLSLFCTLFPRRYEMFHGNVLRECRNRALGGNYHRGVDCLRRRNRT